jgi:hypothetical protein
MTPHSKFDLTGSILFTQCGYMHCLSALLFDSDLPPQIFINQIIYSFLPLPLLNLCFLSSSAVVSATFVIYEPCSRDMIGANHSMSYAP